MKTRKFEIEWQLFKTAFKVYMPAADAEEMGEKMWVAEDVFKYFFTTRSRELAYNVLNWQQGLSIAFKREDTRREVVENSIIKLSRIFEGEDSIGSPAPEKESDQSFTREFMEEYIEKGYKSSPIYTEHISSSFDFRLLIENINQNLDMALKWSKGNYVHTTMMDYIFNATDIILSNEYAELPARVYNKFKKVFDRASEIENDPDSKITHKFLY